MCRFWKKIFVLLSLNLGTSMAAYRVQQFRMVSTDDNKDYEENLLSSRNGTSQAQCATLCSENRLCKTFQTCKPLDLCPATCKTFSSLHRAYIESGVTITGTTINNYDSISDQVPEGDHVFCKQSVCYVFVIDGVYWINAIKACNSRGGNIATVDDDVELSFLNTTINENILGTTAFWVNGIKIRGVWKGFDYMPLSYLNWQVDRPDFNSSGLVSIALTDYIVSTNTHNGNYMMDDEEYAASHAYICEIPILSSP